MAIEDRRQKAAPKEEFTSPVPLDRPGVTGTVTMTVTVTEPVPGPGDSLAGY